MMGPYVEFKENTLSLVTESGPIINECGIPLLSHELLGAEHQYSSPSAGSTCASCVAIRCKESGLRDSSRFQRPIYIEMDTGIRFVIRKFRGNVSSFDRIEIVSAL